MILLCLTVAQSNPIRSRKLNDGHAGLEQNNRSHALVWATKVNGRNGLLAGSLQIILQNDFSETG